MSRVRCFDNVLNFGTLISESGSTHDGKYLTNQRVVVQYGGRNLTFGFLEAGRSFDYYWFVSGLEG